MSLLFTTLNNRGAGRRGPTLLLLSLSWIFSFSLGGIIYPLKPPYNQSVHAGDTFGKPETTVTEEIKKAESAISLKKTKEKMPDLKRRWAYVLLFLLSLPLTYFGLA